VLKGGWGGEFGKSRNLAGKREASFLCGKKRKQKLASQNPQGHTKDKKRNAETEGCCGGTKSHRIYRERSNLPTEYK